MEAGFTVKGTHGFLASIRCVYRVRVVFVCPEQPLCSWQGAGCGHGAVGAAAVCWWPWSALAQGTASDSFGTGLCISHILVSFGTGH